MHTERKPLSINTVIVESEHVQHTVKELLGHGGSGLTYKCLSSDGNYYCLKEVYPTELADCLVRRDDGRIILNSPFDSEEMRRKWDWYHENLIREEEKQRSASSDVAAEANDPYFLKSYGTFVADNGNLYARYDMQKGEPMSHMLETLSPEESLAILITACKKLARLHEEKGMLHLDLSPSNLYVIEHALGKEAYFLDFGSAKAMGEADDAHRFSSTEGYSPVEIMARTEGNRSDIYKIGTYSDTFSLVAILFKALVGETYSVDYRFEPDLWIRRVRERLEKCGAGEVADRLIGILRRGLSESTTRYQSADELFRDLCGVYQAMTGKGCQINALISDIDKRIADFEKALMQKIGDEGEKTRSKVVYEGEKTRAALQLEGRSLRKLILSVAVCLILAVGLLSLTRLPDFEAPQIKLQGCEKTEAGYEISGSYFECLIKIYDNKELDSYSLTLKDLSFDGFDCEADLEHLDDGIYRLTLSNIQREADTAQIIVRGGFAEDARGHVAGEARLPVVFKARPGDSTAPSVVLSHPISEKNDTMVRAGTSVRLLLMFSDETELGKVTVTEETVRALGFRYDRFEVTEHQNGTYTVRFVNVSGDNGECSVYVAPGAAVDANHNYSFGVQSTSFYLYDDEKNIDTVRPEIVISAPEILDDAVEYRVEVDDNVGIRSFAINKNDITTVGFTATVEVAFLQNSSERSVRIIRLRNIQSTSESGEKYIIIDSGVAEDEFGNPTPAALSPSFSFSE